MDEFEPFLAPLKKDMLTPAEYLAREEALQDLIAEAVEQHDEDRLGMFQDALDKLALDNPARGANHQLNACPEAARAASISRNPIKRLGRQAYYRSGFNT